MSVSRKQIGVASALVFLSFTQTGFATEKRDAAGGRLLAMEDKMMKPMQQGAPGQSGSSMGSKDGPPQQMGRDRMMMDDKMTVPQSPPMQDKGVMGQGSMGQQSQGGMMMMMEKMMRGQMGGMTGAGTMPGTADVTERIEGRIAFLKAELKISDAQMAGWNALAEALRSGRQHLVEARKLLVMDDNTSSADRLERYERHLTERVVAIKATRGAFVQLYPTFDETQKRTADEILLPLIATF